MRTRPLFGVGLVVVLALPATRGWLEREMITHMLVQIPLLVIAGLLLTAGITRWWQARIAAWNRLGIPGILLAMFISSWWMVPRALDGALASPITELWKFVSLPLLVGVPLALSWRPLGTVGRGFVIANVLPMWAVVGWLYIAAPVRVCNYYLLDQQVVAGRGLLWASIAVACLTAASSFTPASRARAVDGPASAIRTPSP